MKDLPPIKARIKTGQETFTGMRKGKLILKDFWQWSLSDLVSNATRGILAEFLVASALGLNKGVRNEWGPYDLKTETGIKIEVKSSAYIQWWYQHKVSNITFNIRPTSSWDYKTNRFTKEKKRQADVYVFCLLHHKDKKTINPMDLSQWMFYIVSTKKLDKDCLNNKTISLSRLKKFNPKVCSFHGLKEAIENIVK
jgi:hypothetical protein